MRTGHLPAAAPVPGKAPDPVWQADKLDTALPGTRRHRLLLGNGRGPALPAWTGGPVLRQEGRSGPGAPRLEADSDATSEVAPPRLRRGRVQGHHCVSGSCRPDAGTTACPGPGPAAPRLPGSPAPRPPGRAPTFPGRELGEAGVLRSRALCSEAAGLQPLTQFPEAAAVSVGGPCARTSFPRGERGDLSQCPRLRRRVCPRVPPTAHFPRRSGCTVWVCTTHGCLDRGAGCTVNTKPAADDPEPPSDAAALAAHTQSPWPSPLCCPQAAVTPGDLQDLACSRSGRGLSPSTFSGSWRVPEGDSAHRGRRRRPRPGGRLPSRVPHGRWGHRAWHAGAGQSRCDRRRLPLCW